MKEILSDLRLEI